MIKSYDVHFGKIDGRNFVPGQEGETLLGQTKTYSYGYGDKDYALLTEKDGQYFVRKYHFQPELDRIGAGRYDPDILEVISEDSFANREDADAKLSEVAHSLHTRHMDSLEHAKDKIENDEKISRDYAQFQKLEKNKVVSSLIKDCIKSPFEIGKHFENATEKMDAARNWFIQNAASYRVVADYAIHLDPDETAKNMGAIIADTIERETNPNHGFVDDYFGKLRHG